MIFSSMDCVINWYLLLPVVRGAPVCGSVSHNHWNKHIGWLFLTLPEPSTLRSCKNVGIVDWKEPFNLRYGWLLWAGIGLVGAIIAIALAGTALTFFNGEQPQRETDSLIRLLPLVGSFGISTACLLGITGVLAPVLEETVFRGFLMTSLTKWFPTPVSALISAAVFALAHLTPGEFPQLFVLGTVLGLSYAQTRNLMTPITIHALWNSTVILLLTFLELQGYDIRELLQAS